MAGVDLMENSDGCFDGTAMDGDYPDNLMLGLESLFKILDEEPVSPTQNSSGNPKDSHWEQLDCDQRDYEGFHPQSESFPSEFGTPNCFGESEIKTEPQYGPSVEHKAEIDNSSGICYDEPLDDENPCTSLQVESNGICLLPSVHSANWLRLSSTYFDTSVMDSNGNSFGSFVTDDVNFHELYNNSTNYNITEGRAEESGHLYPSYTNFVGDTDLVGMKGNLVHQDSESQLTKSCTKSSAVVDNISSPCMLQMGEPGLAHFISTTKDGSINERFYDTHRGAMPDSTVKNGNIHQHLERKPADLASQQCNITPDINATEIIYDCHGASNSCLTVPGNFMISAEAASKQSLVRGSSHDEAQLCGNNGAEARLFLSEDSIMCTLQDQSLHSSLLEDSAVDLDAFLPSGLYTQQCHCGDMGMMSESSTDSSPLPSNYNPTLDGSFNKSRHFSDLKMFLQRKEQMNSLKNKRQPQLPSSQEQQYRISKVAKIAVQSNPSRRNSTSDGDADLFIHGGINDTVAPAPPSILVKPHPMTERYSFVDYHAGSGTSRPKANDERLTFRLALQDLSQPKSETNPPDGVLAVPLLRHQRIALSWMVHKETAGLNCSGGILADDQGLGKTISTIALILTERSPPSTSSTTEKKCEYEPLNLDDEDDVDGSSFIENSRIKQSQHSGPSVLDKTLKSDGSIEIVKGRPAAGTLVVCPTSVLRQWAEELRSKITSKANLSFLVYHGSNRTKDPKELAKFDVVLTTYAIVSMEVPKQPLVDKDDTDRGKQDGCSMLAENSDYKKGKEHPSASSRNKKQKNADSSLIEFAPRPLAKVGWFRVILDEAQSIKNHRTQVARACWGLRAKRRWCLSGTPIQNAIDDLYSYFRFLRYDPYAVYKSFCSAIKMPISRNPPNGYKKLQAVLKTIMLRRTKGSLIDGKPVITLPPKTITLKRVDFSNKERNFYLALEAESREQFKVYADAGTVKQNYVNILLMLLRLRQACDHPLLVKGFDSNSIWKSSLETAKMLPKDIQLRLLRCLEAGLEICTICNDAPEDAVVSTCGHVFCNQCICEHLTGDDNICPQANCRNKLSGTSIFTTDTLRSCLSEQPDLGFLSGNSISDLEHGPKFCQESLYSGSSKIRAALEILHSLPISQCTASLCESAEPFNKPSVLSENTVSTISLGCSSNTATDQKYDLQTSNVKLTDKAIVFSQWTRMLDLLEVSLKESCVLYRRLDGTMSVSAREKAIKDFNTLPEVTVMIMSLKAASLGLNMVAACHVVLLDLWWNPTTEDQAIDRAHRIGQTRPVTVSRLTVKDTVEDRILALQEKKREMVASAFGEDESGSRQTRLTVEDLRYLFMV